MLNVRTILLSGSTFVPSFTLTLKADILSFHSRDQTPQTKSQGQKIQEIFCQLWPYVDPLEKKKTF